MDTTNTKPTFAIVELFGHTKIAGQVSPQEFGGASFLRVDVPAIGYQPAFTKSYGAKAVYAINWCDEETATRYAREINATPIQDWSMRSAINAMLAAEKSIEEADTEETPF